MREEASSLARARQHGFSFFLPLSKGTFVNTDKILKHAFAYIIIAYVAREMRSWAKK